VKGNSIVASYVDSLGLRFANVEITCGGSSSALSSPGNTFTTTVDPTTSTTTFTFKYQSNLLCANRPTPPPGPTTLPPPVQCPSWLILNNMAFDPSILAGTLNNQLDIQDGTAGDSYDFAVNLCAKPRQPQCSGSAMQGSYFITEMDEGTTTCAKGLFGTMTKAPTVQGNSVVASYVDATGLRIANVEITCGGTSALSSKSNTFTTTVDPPTSTTTFTFKYQSNLICFFSPMLLQAPVMPLSSSDRHHRHESADVVKRLKQG
jgi:hypothetical protein